MKIYRKHRISLLTGAVAILMGATGCSDDLDTGFGVNEVEGRDTQISLSVSAPEMPRLESRADMADEDAYNVETLWVGIYNSGSGKSTLLDGTNNGLFLQDGDPDNNHGFSGGVKSHDRYALENIATKSGRSYIVAVANPDKNMGYKMGTNGTIGNETSLLTLLQEASTWEEFKSIVISRPLRENGAADIFMPNATVNPLVMSGIYLDEKNNTHGEPLDWDNVEPVYIGVGATGVTLPGAIHLRRPYSQIKFDIQRAENTEIVDFKVESYVVHNVPTYGWLFERKQAENPAGKPWEYANAGDPMELDVTKNTNYRSSLTYTSADIEGSNNHFTFDFWQMENKRMGILEGADATDYQKRDVEWDDGNRNTGVYKSLCPSATPTLNNFAGYVEINAKLTYKNAVTPDNPETIPGIPNEEFDYTSREVNAKYIVHLGYIGGNANDFNSLRNSIYTYSVKIRSASEIIVEAFTNNENQPGAEGTVIDVTKQMFNLDAHYAAFNIELTREDLNSFSFSILADNYRFAIGEDGQPTANSNRIPTSTTDDTYPYYSWIELAKTTGEDVLADYPGIGKAGLYKLKDIRDNAATLEPGWYTVFVNEYTYEDESEDNRGNEKTNWRNYVNKPNRMAYLNVAQHVSADGLSSYYRSKYAVSQRSIQTYYNAAEATTALGVEHDNETFGMNIRWLTDDATNINGGNYPGVPITWNGDNAANLSADNGRYNVWISSGGSADGTTAGRWETYVQTTKPNAVNRITNTNQNLPPELRPAKTWPVPMPMLLAPGNFTQEASYVSTGSHPFPNVYDRRAGDYDPQINHTSAQYIQAMHACMNRNRDLDGNGEIDADELRWYLPAAGKYVRVILGRNSLSTPIMDYDSTPTLPFGSGRGQNSRFHMISSDNVIIWCEEGLSRSMMNNNQGYSGPPWAVRCIRNLGTNLRNVTSDEKVDPAYDGSDLGTDNYSTGGVVKVKHYYGTSLRDNSGEALPMHKSNSAYNKLGRYGFEIALRGNQTTQQNTEASATGYRGSTTAYTNAVNAASPCATLNAPLPNGSGRTGWRVPNQKEIVIMRRLGVLSSSFYMTCTQEYWNNQTGSSTSNTFNRILTVRSDAACAAPYSDIGVVRCVRDLTAAEANKSYDEIRQNL